MHKDIPGFYFDPEKKKYFKIEKSTTAPSSAAWSSDAVKKRKADHLAEEAARSRQRLLKHHVKRSGLVFRNDDATKSAAAGVASAMMRREVGDLGSLVRRAGLEDVLGPVAWADGLIGRGRLDTTENHASAGDFQCLWIGGKEEGLSTGVAYFPMGENFPLFASYIHTDRNGVIKPRPRLFIQPVSCSQMSSVKYHAASNRMIVTSREPGVRCRIHTFSPSSSEEAYDGSRSWELGAETTSQDIRTTARTRSDWLVNSCAPAPPAAWPNTLCALGTNDGILRVDMAAIRTIPTRSFDTANAQSAKHQKDISDYPYDNTGIAPPRMPRDIFDVAFHNDHPQLLVAAGRDYRVLHADLRTRGVDWSYFPTPSSVARVIPVGEHAVLTCGLRSNMAMYDLRFTKHFRSRHAGGGVDPIVSFPSHHNEAHWQIGIDVQERLGIAAAAQDNGTVKLFSLRTGAALRNAAVDAIKRPIPVKSLMFKTMPDEKGPSLFVGEGKKIAKYSWGSKLSEGDA